MKGEIQAFLEENGKRNGYYERDLLTKYGKIEELKVPRDSDDVLRTCSDSISDT